MKQIISIDYFENLKHIPLIDVRSPGEFAKDTFQMPNLELFSDEERAVVTAYKKNQRKGYRNWFCM
jgi:tRNA 2-selenouridine synthase